MGATFLQSGFGSAAARFFNPPSEIDLNTAVRTPPARVRVRAYNDSPGGGWRVAEKPSICTADELHYVPVHNSDWRLALWRYLPSSQGKQRNHPLLLLSGVGTNAIGYDLAPGTSFARYMSNQGFDTWILELRGAGLSAQHCLRESLSKIDEEIFATTEISTVNGQSRNLASRTNDHQLTTKLTKSRISDGLSYLITEGFFESAIASQFRNLSEKLRTIIQEGQSVPSPLVDLQGRFTKAIDDLQKQINLIDKYNWDFDHYLEEDLPAAMDYIRTHCRPKDDKLLAIGHSMGGILLYAMLSQKSNIPSKLLFQLATAFQKGGLRDRTGTISYKDHLHKSNVPILALAGDQDLICPPEAVYETVKLIPENLITFKVLGEPSGPHYGHYDLVGGRTASDEVYPHIIEFLTCYDQP